MNPKSCENSMILRKFIQLNIDDSDIFTIFDSEASPVFTGSSSQFFDACLENPDYCKYLKWNVVCFSSDSLHISESVRKGGEFDD